MSDEDPPKLRLVTDGASPPRRAHRRTGHRKPAKAVEPVSAWDVYLRAIAHGATERDAAAIAGSTRDLLRTWAHADPERRAAMEKAQAEVRQRVARVIIDAAESGDWKAAAWWLEKRDREAYGVKVDATVQTVTDDTAARLAALVALRRGA